MTVTGRRLILTPTIRLDLPATDSNYDSATAAVAPAIHATLELSPSFHWHGKAAALVWGIGPLDNLDGRAALAVATDATRQLVDWFAATAGIELQSGWYGGGIDHLLVRAGGRFPLGCYHRLEIAVALPLVGDERTNLALQLGLTRDL